MKKSALLFSLFLLMLAAVSCKKEYSYEGGQYRKCVSCNYLPVCDSSVYIYIDSTPGRTDTLENIMSVLGDTTIGGKKFTFVSGFATFNTGVYANCDNQDYRLLFPLAALGLNLDSLVAELLQQLPFPIPPNLINIPSTLQTSVLKANLPVNGTWSDTLYTLNVPPLLSLSIALDYTILAKGIQHQVYSNNFSNVIRVSSTLNLTSTLINLPLDFSIEYFFARDVGLVEVQIWQGPQLQRVLKLYDYEL